MVDAHSPPLELSPTAERILKTAERLYALKGVNSVSTREISREAGQKNHSALHYHFGSEEDLINAILDYRMIPLNRAREQRLIHLSSGDNTRDIRALLSAYIAPFAHELLNPPEHRYYISVLLQLCSQHSGRRIVASNRRRSSAQALLAGHLCDVMAPLSPVVAQRRLSWVERLVVNAVADWDQQHRVGDIELNPQSLTQLTEQLLDFLVGGLSVRDSAA